MGRSFNRRDMSGALVIKNEGVLFSAVLVAVVELIETGALGLPADTEQPRQFRAAQQAVLDTYSVSVLDTEHRS